jgi:hypothetical protein
VLCGGMLQDAVDDAVSAEPGRDREPPGHGGGPEPPDLLHPPDVQLQVRPTGGQRVKAARRTRPGSSAGQIRCAHGRSL